MSSIPLSPPRFALQCPGADCKYEESNPDKMRAHLISKHATRLRVSAETERAYRIPRIQICPGCRILFVRVRKHLNAKKSPCPAPFTDGSVDRALDAWQAIASSASSTSPSRSSRLARPYYRQPWPAPSHSGATTSEINGAAADHPLPMKRPRVWARVPPELRDRFINILRPGFMAYTHTSDTTVKARIFIELHRAINHLLRKVHGNGGGKALSSLRRHMEQPAAAAGIFAEFRPQFPARSPTAPPVPVVVDIWVDGSAGTRKNDGNDEKKGETGIGVLVLDTRLGLDHRAPHSAYLGTGTNNSAELGAIIFALELYATEPLIQLRINTDSQYAYGQAGHDDVNIHHRLVHHLRGLIRKRTPPPIFRKVAAHAGVKENEEADRLAGEARTRRAPQPPAASFLASQDVPLAPPSSLSSSMSLSSSAPAQ